MVHRPRQRLTYVKVQAQILVHPIIILPRYFRSFQLWMLRIKFRPQDKIQFRHFFHRDVIIIRGPETPIPVLESEDILFLRADFAASFSTGPIGGDQQKLGSVCWIRGGAGGDYAFAPHGIFEVALFEPNALDEHIVVLMTDEFVLARELVPKLLTGSAMPRRESV